MSHERKRTTITYEQSLIIIDDDEDRLEAVKEANRSWVMLTATSGMGAEIDHHSVRLNMSDARALRRFLNEFLAGLDDDDEDYERPQQGMG